MKYIKNLALKRKIRIRNRGAKEFCEPLSSAAWLEMFGGNFGSPDVKRLFRGRLKDIRAYYTPLRPSREFFA